MTDDVSWLEGDADRAAIVVPVFGATKRELSAALGWAMKRLDKAARDGMPCRTTGSNRGGLRFDLPNVIEWLVTQAAGDATDSMAEAKRAYTLAQARLKQIEADRIANKLIEVDAVTAIVNRIYREANLQLSKLHHELQIPVEQQDYVAGRIEEILRSLSEEKIVEEFFEAEDEVSEAA